MITWCPPLLLPAPADSVESLTIIALIIAEFHLGGAPPPNVPLFYAVYAPWILMPALLLWRVWGGTPFPARGAGGEGKAARKRR